MIAEPLREEPPTTLVVRPDDVPQDLLAYPLFVNWRWERRDGRWTKPPINPKTGGYARANDPTTAASFGDALGAMAWHDYPGVGFLLTPTDPFGFVDLDDCRDPDTGMVAPWAAAFLHRFAGTYAEASPSGTGVKIVGRFRVPGARHVAAVGGGKVEVFAESKYTTLTGHRLEGASPRVADCQAAVDSLCAEVFAPAEPPRASDGAPPSADPDDEQLLVRARNAANGEEFRRLFDHGGIGPYGNDWSRADLALANHLAFWFGPDPARVDAMFRRSALMREKWDTRHYGDGRTYGQGTVDAALAGRTEFYRARHPADPPTTPNGRAHDTPPPAPARFNPTDYGNAERFVARHRGDVRYCYPWKTWLAWDGRRWKVDDGDAGRRLAKETVRSIYAEAAAAEDEKERAALAKHAMRSEAAAKVEALLDMAESEAGVPVSPDDLDRDPWLLNVLNGTLDLRTGELRPHGRADLITKLAPVAYDAGAACPTWDAFLEQIMAGDDEMVAFLQRAAGYALSGDTSERALFLLHGTGRNGKGTFLEALRSVLGPDYAARTTTDTLLATRDNAIPNDVARLKGMRFVFANEADEGRRLAEAKVKDLTGGDTISARFMRAEWFEFRPEFKLWLATNHKPDVRGTDHAIWDRIRLVPFSVRIDAPDRRLGDRLLAEAPGILRWAVRGALEWQAVGLGEPEGVRLATEGYRAESDVLGTFLGDACAERDDLTTPAKALYAAYQRWCEDAGEKPLSQKALGQRLSERGYRPVRLRGGIRAWRGLALRDGDSASAQATMGGEMGGDQ